jgi:DNA-binding FrmR family transcriptional regulator
MTDNKDITADEKSAIDQPQGHYHDGHWHTHENVSDTHDYEHEHQHEHTHSHGNYEHSHEHEHLNDGSEAHGHTHTHLQTKSVLNRLSRINGHIGAVKRMVEDGRDCPEVLIQLAAVRSAIDGVCKIILKDHLDHCIVDAVETGDTGAIEQLNRAIEILMR